MAKITPIRSAMNRIKTDFPNCTFSPAIKFSNHERIYIRDENNNPFMYIEDYKTHIIIFEIVKK